MSQFDSQRSARSGGGTTDMVRSRFEALVKAMDCIAIVLDVKGQVLAWSQAAEEATNINYDSALGKKLEALDFDWRDQVLMLIQRASERRKTVAGHEIMIPRPGATVMLGVSVYLVDACEEGGTELLILGRDITKKKRLEEVLGRNARLQSIGELAAGIAHEINTPAHYAASNLEFIEAVIGDIKGVLESIVDPKQEVTVEGLRERLVEMDIESLSVEADEAIADARFGLAEIARIVGGVRKFAHPGGSESAAHANLNDAVECAVQVTESRWKTKAKVKCEFGDDLMAVWCRIAGIRQVLVNLISNAADAYDEEGFAHLRTIVVQTRRDGDWAVITISDQAGGMSNTVVRQVFDPFFTTKPVGEGTGQGLALAHSIIADEHGGTIEVDTCLGHGTRFEVRIPALEPTGR